jgi:hypothetical protein
MLLVFLFACSGQSILLDSSQPDAPICEYEPSYHCDYRSAEILATCTDYSAQAFDYLETQTVKNTGSGLAEACSNNNANWGAGRCPVDDTWVGVCVAEVGGTIGLIYGTHYYSEPELELPDGTVIIYDDASASASCIESTGAEWCNDGAE